MTGPYAFKRKTWVAFDDDASLKIKCKYALLRNLGGVGLFGVDSDDADDACGKGKHSLLRAMHATVTQLERKPRQLVRRMSCSNSFSRSSSNNISSSSKKKCEDTNCSGFFLRWCTASRRTCSPTPRPSPPSPSPPPAAPQGDSHSPHSGSFASWTRRAGSRPSERTLRRC